MTRSVTLAHLSAVQMAPSALIRMAAETGYDGAGLRLIRVTPTSPGYPLWQDARMLAETEAALADTGMTCGDIEFVKITPEFDLASLTPFFETGARLGAKLAIAAPYDPDEARLADSLGRMAEASAALGIRTALEFFPWVEVASLNDAVRVVEQAGEKPGILLDALHFDRSGGRIEDIAAVPAGRLALFHLCDAERLPAYTAEQLLFTAREGRLPPGEGAIDLPAILAALPADLPVGIETPMDALAAREGLREVARRAREGARVLGV